MPKNKISRIWLDFETTGVPDINRGVHIENIGLTQLAFVIEDEDGKVLEMGDYNICPFEGCDVQRKALEITGKNYDEIFTYEDEATVLKHFLAVVEKHINKMSYEENFTIGAYNGNFDIQFLDAWMKRHNKKFFSYFNYHMVDPLALLRILRFEKENNLESQKLSVVYKEVFGKEFDAHDAVADILATRELYYFLTENYINFQRR